jgi:hypothetical protein
MIHIRIPRDQAVEYLKQCDALEGFITSDSIVGRLMTAIRQSLGLNGVQIEVTQGQINNTANG